MRNKFMAIALFLIALAIIFDTFSTLAFSFGINFYEINPYMDWLLEKGPKYFIGIKLLQQLALLSILWIGKKHKLAIIGTALLISVHIPLVIWHIRLWQKYNAII